MEPQFKVDVKLEGSELVMRHGKAQELLPPVEPQVLNIYGDFKAVSQFLNGRKQGDTENEYQLALQTDSIILTNKEKLYIKLYCNPNNPLATTVTAKAQLSDELKLFGINTGSTYRRDELFKLVRMNRIHFADNQQHNDLLAALKAFRASTAGNTNLESDQRGNKNVAYQKQVTSNMPETFKLNIPIIKGEPKEIFNVEVCLNESDGIATFWFESPELNELMAKRIEEMFERELKHCEGFVIVNE